MKINIPLINFDQDCWGDWNWSIPFSEHFKLDHKKIKQFDYRNDTGEGSFTLLDVEYEGCEGDIVDLICDSELGFDSKLSWQQNKRIASALYDYGQHGRRSPGMREWFSDYRVEKNRRRRQAHQRACYLGEDYPDVA